jgi:hypothetical protein
MRDAELKHKSESMRHLFLQQPDFSSSTKLNRREQKPALKVVTYSAKNYQLKLNYSDCNSNKSQKHITQLITNSSSSLIF